jgi:hypothetical protein
VTAFGMPSINKSICPLKLGKLRCIPSAADSFDQENTRIHATSHEIDVIALIGQEHRLRRDYLQIVVDAARVAIRKELK